MPRYTQHKSGTGARFEVQSIAFHSINVIIDGENFWLPSSEYVLLPEEKKWVDVTDQCVFSDGLLAHNISPGSCLLIFIHQNSSDVSRVRDGYRLIKRPFELPHNCGKELSRVIPAFIVEHFE